MWYLGERVACQSLDSRDFLVPFDPPASMFSFKSLVNSELSQFKIWVYAHEFIDHDADYAEFRSRLMPLIWRLLVVRFSPGADPRADGAWGGEDTDTTHSRLGD